VPTISFFQIIVLIIMLILLFGDVNKLIGITKSGFNNFMDKRGLKK
jgi:Sec-independent protein translocase protein TatA